MSLYLSVCRHCHSIMAIWCKFYPLSNNNNNKKKEDKEMSCAVLFASLSRFVKCYLGVRKRATHGPCATFHTFHRLMQTHQVSALWATQFSLLLMFNDQSTPAVECSFNIDSGSVCDIYICISIESY